MKRQPFFSKIRVISVLLLFMMVTLPATLDAQREDGRRGRDAKRSLIRPDSDVIYLYVEQRAQFPGGDSALVAYLMENLKYPESARDSAIEGIVYVSFVVERDGSISNVAVDSRWRTHPILEAAAIEVVRKMPVWTPAQQRGKVVRAQFVLPVHFMLTKDDKKKKSNPSPPPTQESPSDRED